MGKIIKNQGNKGFTTMFNDHFHDKRLSWAAKGMLSNVFSLPDNWEFSVKGFQTMSSDGERVVRSCLFELEWFGYLQRIQVRTQKGVIVDYDYEFFNESQLPDKTEKVPKWSDRKSFESVRVRVIDKDTGETIEERPYLQNVDTDTKNPERQNAVLDFADVENAVQLNTNKLNTKDINNISNQSINHKKNKTHSNLPKQKVDRLIDSETISDVRDQIYYDLVKTKIDPEILEIIVICIAELYTTSEPMSFNGRSYAPDIVRKKSLAIKAEHVEYVYDCFINQREKVNNVRKYLLTAVFNAPDTMSAYTENDVRAKGMIW